MAPLTKYDSPLVQLARLLRVAKLAGLPFEAAWAAAVRPDRAIIMVTHPCPPPEAVQWPTDRNDRITWRTAIEDSRDGWRRAYEECEPTAPERALLLLAPALDTLAEVRELDELRTQHAGIGAQSAVPSAA